MPTAPLRPCPQPGCSVLTKNGPCERHRKQRQQEYDKYQRNPEARRFYRSKFWRALSKSCRQRAYGLCEICKANGRLKQGNQADHKIPREQGGADDLDNLQWLCAECHSRKSAEEGSRW